MSAERDPAPPAPAEPFAWHERLAIGLGAIDDQHRGLLERVADVQAARARAATPPTVDRALAALIEATRAHFEHEERLMDRHEYPHLDRHRAEHQALMRTVRALQAEHARGELDVTPTLITFLVDWLVHHIDGADRAMAVFMARRAPDPAAG